MNLIKIKEMNCTFKFNWDKDRERKDVINIFSSISTSQDDSLKHCEYQHPYTFSHQPELVFIEYNILLYISLYKQNRIFY